MRLTLRTLLAYLDDTLAAGEIKQIGQKVSESDAAQELIARIKQVTRRRRLTVPPATGPSGIDPNEVAEYLDNELASDKVTELEKLALESDVHLAEIASCHQILTLVLGEPALVPPKAKERMYRLVAGREAIPYRKAQPVANLSGDHHDDEEALSLSSGWLRWVLPAAGLLLVVALGLAVYQVLPPGQTVDSRVAVKKGGETPVVETPDPLPKPPEPMEKEPKPEDKGSPLVPKVLPPDPPGKEPINRTPQTPAPITRAGPPSEERVAIATYQGGLLDLPTALVVREPGKEEWQRVAEGARVQTGTQLVTLPGYTSVLRTSSGVALLMRGHVREFSVSPIMDYIMESAITLHASKDFDLELTLQRGRIFLTNRKDEGPCKIRLRFENEVWDLTLENPGDEIGVDVFRTYTPAINYRAGEEPRTYCYLAFLRGDISIRIDAFHTYNLEVMPPKWAYLEWDSFTRLHGPTRVDRLPPSWDKSPPAPELLSEAQRDTMRRMQAAMKDFQVLLSGNRAVDVALKEFLQKTDPMSRVLAIYCLGAIDSLGQLAEALGDEDPAHYADRAAAFFTLQRVVSRGNQEGKLLYNEQNGTGVLIDRKYKKGEAATIYQLLHPLLVENLGKIETYQALAGYLQSSRVAIAELGFWHLVELSQGVKLPQGFNSAAPQEVRERYAGQILTMIDKKQLPPRPPEPNQPMPEKKDN